MVGLVNMLAISYLIGNWAASMHLTHPDLGLMINQRMDVFILMTLVSYKLFTQMVVFTLMEKIPLVNYTTVESSEKMA